jgi:hypothetical protein
MVARASAGIALAALMLCAQSSREAYRAAYRVWHEADPNLERDAATAGAPIGARADRMAAEAARYHAERRSFLDQFSHENSLAWLAASPPEAGPARANVAGDYAATETGIVRRAIESFRGDPDPGIQQVRNMLERENLALGALTASLAVRDQAAAEADAAVAAVDEAWRKASDRDREMLALIAKSGVSVDEEKAAWVEYYRTFSDAARGATPGVTPDGGLTPPLRPAEPAPRPSITPLPLVRYTGDWIFPQTGGLYHGAQPESIDLVVREDNGHCEGRMVARFKLPAGSPGDPNVRFDFKGDFKNTRAQTFALETSDGSQGTIDLIPGPAFNLLEVNVQIAANPGKIRQANAVLIKK